MTYRCPCHICSEHTWDHAKVEYSPTVRGWYILLDKTRES